MEAFRDTVCRMYSRMSAYKTQGRKQLIKSQVECLTVDTQLFVPLSLFALRELSGLALPPIVNYMWAEKAGQTCDIL